MELKLDINYATYCNLSDDKKREYAFLIEFILIDGKHLEEKNYISETAIEDLPFGVVKDMMSAYLAENFEELIAKIFELDEYSAKIFVLPAWQVLLSCRHICKRISELIQIENQTLVSQFPNEYSMQMEMIDFTMFNQEYLQLNDLAGGDITKFEKIRRLKYSDCFVQLLYMFKNSELEKAVYQSKKLK